MSWHFSQALEAAFSGENSLAGEPSAPSNSTPTPQAYLSPDRMTAFSRLSRFGMTFAPLTADRGEELLILFLAAFPARTSQPPAREPASPAPAPGSGAKWRESSVKWDPATSSWKTHRCLWEEDLDWSSVTWPRWGMMRAGVLWEPTTPVEITSATASGLWQTPVADDAVDRKEGKRNSRGEPKLSAQVKLWPTPRANDGEKRSNFDATNPRNGLAGAAKLWPTPRTTGLDGGSNSRKAAKERGMWPTPICNDAKNDNPPSQAQRNTPPLNVAVHMFATPQARDFRTGQTSRWENPERTRNLNDQIGGSLNPTWVEWLMGWPLHWTSLDALSMSLYLDWYGKHTEANRPQDRSSEVQDRKNVRNMWWHRDPSEAPPGRKLPEQQAGEHCDALPVMPHEDSYDASGLGKREGESGNVQGVRPIIPAKTVSKGEVVRETGVPEGTGEIVSRTSVGIADRVDRTRCLGNGQVPAVVRLAWNILTGAI